MELDLPPSEDEIGGYIPLERPSCSNTNSVPTPRQPIVYSDDGSRASSSDDSDDMKILKNPLKRKIPQEIPKSSYDPLKKKKFSVWSEILQEDAIENQFNDSQFFGGCRGNETYNYRMKYFANVNGNEAAGDSRMNEDSRGNQKNDIKNRPWAKRRNKFTRKLKLDPLEVTAEDTDEKVILDIAKKLNEPKTDLIEKIVDTLGKQKAIDFFNKTREIEQKGGYLTLDKSRRRTSGGVFLKLVKNSKLNRKNFDAIFKHNDDFGKNFKGRQEDVEPMYAEENESKKDDDYKDLPSRAELELSLSVDDSDTNVLKNPPPSPVYPSASLTGNSCSLSDLFPNTDVRWPSSSKDSWSNPTNPATYCPKSPDYLPTSPDYSPRSPEYSLKTPDNSPSSPI